MGFDYDYDFDGCEGEFNKKRWRCLMYERSGKIIGIIIVCLILGSVFSGVAQAATLLKHVHVWWWEDGQQEEYLYISPGSSITINRDAGSQVQIRIFQANDPYETVTFYTTDVWNGINRQKTSANYYEDFTDAIGPLPTEVMAYVNTLEGAVTINVNNLAPQDPDLYVSNIRVDGSTTPGEYSVGEQVKVECIVWNGGEGTAGSSYLGYYIGTSSTDTSDRWDADGVGSLDGGVLDKENEYEYYTFQASDVGTRYFVLWADYRDDVDEGDNEGNNKASFGPFSVYDPNTCPTLDVTEPSSDQTVRQGQSVQIQWDGTDPDDEATVSIGYDEDNIFDNGNHYWIALGQSEDGSYSWDTSDVDYGTYYIFGMIYDGECSAHDYASGRVTVGPSAPAIELVLYRISDTSGTPNTSNPGTIETSFYSGETVRVTLRADNTGETADVKTTLNIREPDDTTIFYDSHDSTTTDSGSREDNTNDSPLTNTEGYDYYSFDKIIPLDATPGWYDIIGAMRNQAWTELWDTTAPGRADSDWDNAWVHDQFEVLEPVYGTTIITHGYKLWFGSSIPPWTIEMARAIRDNRPGKGKVMVYDKDTRSFDPIGDPEDSDGGEVILVFDWVTESNNAYFGYSEAAGDALFAALLMGEQNEDFSLNNLHFIGHSRGCVVNSEAVERLIAIGRTVDHVTNLDPHDWGTSAPYFPDDFDVNPALDEQGVVFWDGSVWADTYYQDGGTLQGRSVTGSYNVYLGSQNHSYPREWYLDNINNLSSTQGYYYSRIGGGAGNRPSLSGWSTPIQFRFSLDGIVNGNFSRGPMLLDYLAFPGWDEHGGGGDAHVDNGHLELDSGNTWREHNIFYIPPEAERISFRYWITKDDSGSPPDVDCLKVSIGDPISGEYDEVFSEWLNHKMSDYALSSFGVADYQDSVRTIKFEIKKGGWFFNSEVWIDDVQLVMAMSAIIDLSPSSHDYENIQVGQCSSTYPFTLENIGGETASGSVFLTGSNANQFTITSGGGSFSLGAGATKTVNVKFCPTSEGDKSATLYADGSNCNDDSSSLSGTGILPQRTITFYTDPTDGGTITFDGYTFSNGQSTTKTDGSYPISANPASNYVFDNWSTIGAVSVANPNSQSTTAAVSGDGSIKAWFNYVPSQKLSYSPTSYNFGDKCEGETDSTTFEIWNSGTGTLTYTLSESYGWVDVHPTDGSSTGGHDTITVDIDTTGLSLGSHTCYISISSNDGSGTFTVTVNVVPSPKFGVDLSCNDPVKNIAPSETATYTLTVKNIGNQHDAISLSHSTPPSDWSASLDKNSVSLDSEDSTDVTLSVTAPPDAHDGDSATITVTGTSQGNTSKSDSVTTKTTVSIQPILDVKVISPSGKSGTQGETLTYTFGVKNTGTVQDTYELQTTSGHDWNVQISDTSITVDPSQTKGVQVNITIPGDATAGTTDLLTLKATSLTDASVFDENSSTVVIPAETGNYTVTDDFNDGIIDETIWVHNGWSGGTLVESGGTLYFETGTSSD